MMSKVQIIICELWILNIFLEWGSWLNEEIEQEQVMFGIFVMWWFGCIGIWLKFEGGVNVCVDFWCGIGKQSYGNLLMKIGYQMQWMVGVKKLQFNLCIMLFVLDLFVICQIDVVFVIYDYNDYIDVNVVVVVMQNCLVDVLFIGLKICVDLWIGWGVLKVCCIVMKSGDVVKIKDIEIYVFDVFDCIVLIIFLVD